jgi:cytoskeletal protein CcmA (bactofilin family)
MNDLDARATGTYGAKPVPLLSTVPAPSIDNTVLQQITPKPFAAKPVGTVAQSEFDRIEALMGDSSSSLGKIIEINPERDGIRTAVAEGDTCTGDIVLKNGGRIAGTVHGNVTALNGTIIVDANGVIKGNVKASKRVVCLGHILAGQEGGECEVNCPGLVVVAQEGTITGNVVYGQIVTYDNGLVEGTMIPMARMKS